MSFWTSITYLMGGMHCQHPETLVLREDSKTPKRSLLGSPQLPGIWSCPPLAESFYMAVHLSSNINIITYRFYPGSQSS